MFQHLHLQLNERAVLVRDGQAVRALGPGRYTFWKRYDVTGGTSTTSCFTRCRGARGDAGRVVRDGQARAGPVRHRPARRAPVAFSRRVSTGCGRSTNVRLRVLAETDPLPELTDELRKVIPPGELLEANLELNQRAVLLRDGNAVRVLAPGHHAFCGKRRKLATWNVERPRVLGAARGARRAAAGVVHDGRARAGRARGRVPRRQAAEVPASGCPPHLDGRPERRRARVRRHRPGAGAHRRASRDHPGRRAGRAAGPAVREGPAVRAGSLRGHARAGRTRSGTTRARVSRSSCSTRACSSSRSRARSS